MERRSDDVVVIGVDSALPLRRSVSAMTAAADGGGHAAVRYVATGEVMHADVGNTVCSQQELQILQCEHVQASARQLPTDAALHQTTACWQRTVACRRD